jgi:hypothetical protein
MNLGHYTFVECLAWVHRGDVERALKIVSLR